MRSHRPRTWSATRGGRSVTTEPTLEAAIKAQAHGLGFDLVGITTTGPAETAPHFDKWLGEGKAGAMEYLHKNAHLRRDTTLPFEGGASAIVVGLNYGGKEPTGAIARYARGD